MNFSITLSNFICVLDPYGIPLSLLFILFEISYKHIGVFGVVNFVFKIKGECLGGIVIKDVRSPGMELQTGESHHVCAGSQTQVL